VDTSTSNDRAQVATIGQALLRIGLQWDDILFVAADSTAVNPAICNLAKTKFIGCKAHTVALALNVILQPYRKPKSKKRARKDGDDALPPPLEEEDDVGDEDDIGPHLFTEQRQRMNHDHETLEFLIYLKVNRSWWNVHTVGQALSEKEV
jgi:hypothetical protein